MSIYFFRFQSACCFCNSFFYIYIYMELRLRGGTIIFFSKSYLFSLRNLISKQKMYTIRYNSFLIVYCLYYMAHRNFLSFFSFFVHRLHWRIYCCVGLKHFCSHAVIMTTRWIRVLIYVYFFITIWRST